MFRRVPISLMLLSQLTLAAMPVCFVQCIAPNGTVCVQLAGSICHCCDSDAEDVQNGSSAFDSDEAHPFHCCDERFADSRIGHHSTAVLGVCGDCGCQHSLLETAPVVSRKSVSETMRSYGLAVRMIELESSIRSSVDPENATGSRLLTYPLTPRGNTRCALAPVVLRI